MQSLHLPAHLVCVGLWLGCVLTEVAFERTLAGKGPATAELLADLHWRVDAWIELPVLCAVLVSGALLLQHATISALLVLKLVAAGLAMISNLACACLVWRRACAARTGDWARFAALDLWQHRLGALVLLGILVALGLAPLVLAVGFGMLA